MRCPSCEKFVSYDTEVEPEEQDVTHQVEGNTVTIDASFRRVLSCADCGEELKETTFELEGVTLELSGADNKEGDSGDCPHEDVEVTTSAEPTMRMQDKDRHGKPIKRARYMKTLYGVQVEFEAKCETCGATGTASANDEQQASGFDELV